MVKSNHGYKMCQILTDNERDNLASKRLYPKDERGGCRHILPKTLACVTRPNKAALKLLLLVTWPTAEWRSSNS